MRYPTASINTLPFTMMRLAPLLLVLIHRIEAAYNPLWNEAFHGGTFSSAFQIRFHEVELQDSVTQEVLWQQPSEEEMEPEREAMSYHRMDFSSFNIMKGNEFPRRNRWSGGNTVYLRLCRPNETSTLEPFRFLTKEEEEAADRAAKEAAANNNNNGNNNYYDREREEMAELMQMMEEEEENTGNNNNGNHEEQLAEQLEGQEETQQARPPTATSRRDDDGGRNLALGENLPGEDGGGWVLAEIIVDQRTFDTNSTTVTEDVVELLPNGMTQTTTKTVTTEYVTKASRQAIARFAGLDAMVGLGDKKATSPLPHLFTRSDYDAIYCEQIDVDLFGPDPETTRMELRMDFAMIAAYTQYRWGSSNLNIYEGMKVVSPCPSEQVCRLTNEGLGCYDSTGDSMLLKEHFGNRQELFENLTSLEFVDNYYGL